MHQRTPLLRRVCSALITFSLTASVLFPAFPTLASPSIVIGEIAWAGSSASAADEWIELWNLSNAEVSIDGFVLSGASEEPLALPKNAVIPPRGTFLIANYSHEDEKSALAVPPPLITTAVSISNSKLSIALLDKDGFEIDRVGDGGAPPAGTSGAIKVTMIRLADGWMNATSSAGYDEGRNDLGTPGVCDGCAPPAPETPLEPPPMPPIEETLPTSTPATPSVEYFSEPAPSISSTSTEPVLLPEATSTASTTSTSFYAASTPTLPETSDASTSTSSSTTTHEILSASSTAPLPDSPSITSTPPASLPSVPPQPSVSAAPPPAPPVSAPPPPQTATSNTAASSPPPFHLLRLNELMPQPEGENEWIEIVLMGTGNEQFVSLQGVQLHDAMGKIFTYASGTMSDTAFFFRIFLPLARLNNGGDTLTLRDPTGQIIDVFSYSSSQKGKTWARYPDGIGAWDISDDPTPDAANPSPPIGGEPVEPPAEPAAVAIATVVTEEPPAAAVVTVIPDESPEGGEPIELPGIDPPSKPALPKKTSPPPKPKVQPLAKTTAKTKSAAVKSTAVQSPTQLTHAMLADYTEGGLRVSLKGSVGSPPGLLPGHSFALLSPDGRGLMIRVPSTRKLPEFKEQLTVTGSLVFDSSSIPILKVNSNDGWHLLDGVHQVAAPRTMSLIAPGAEDAWSLVNATGTVKAVRTSVVQIETADGDVDVAIKPLVKYRGVRLAIGDVIAVSGLLDVTPDVPRLLPRQAEDIQLVRHASPAEKKKAPGLPDWAPFGAAGLAVAGTEGIKRLRQMRKQRSLEKTLQTGLNESNV